MPLHTLALLLCAVASAAPAAACGDDFLPGFMGHGIGPDMTEAEAEDARRAAREQARLAFVSRFSLSVDAPPVDWPATKGPEAPARPATAGPVPGVEQRQAP